MVPPETPPEKLRCPDGHRKATLHFGCGSDWGADLTAPAAAAGPLTPHVTGVTDSCVSPSGGAVSAALSSGR